MLRYTLKRVLWILPSLLVATWVLFWFVSQARPLEEVRRSDDGGVRDAERAGFREQKLPLFFNFKPRDIRGLTKEAMDLARAEDTMDVARRMFTYLGGASLPYVRPATARGLRNGLRFRSAARRGCLRRMGAFGPARGGHR